MHGGDISYECRPDPDRPHSFLNVTGLIYRLAEFCYLTDGLVPGFSLRLSHLGVRAYEQHVFKNYALRMTPSGSYSLNVSLSGTVRHRLFNSLPGSIFDLA